MPNIENHNGFFAKKGLSANTSLLFELNTKRLYFSFQPEMYNNFDYDVSSDLPKKTSEFSVLNDVPQPSNYPNINNLGFKINFYDYFVGYGNWNDWWGPGIHNSLVLSNNSRGFYHFKFGTKDFKEFKNLSYKNEVYRF